MCEGNTERLNGENMLKGINRNMIVVRTPNTSRFEVAYFILKKGDRTDSRKKILEEANAMIAEGEGNKKEKGMKLKRAAWFGLGILVGGSAALTVCLLIL